MYHFVWTTTLWSALILFLLVPIVEYIIDRDLRMERWAFRAAFSVLGGLTISLVAWWMNEAKYKNARISTRMK